MIHIGGFPSWATKYTKHASGKHDDVPTEWEYTKIIAAYNGFQDADAIGYGAIANASFYTHFPLQKEYPQYHGDSEEQRYSPDFGADVNLHLRYPSLSSFPSYSLQATVVSYPLPCGFQ